MGLAHSLIRPLCPLGYTFWSLLNTKDRHRNNLSSPTFFCLYGVIYAKYRSRLFLVSVTTAWCSVPRAIGRATFDPTPNRQGKSLRKWHRSSHLVGIGIALIQVLHRTDQCLQFSTTFASSNVALSALRILLRVQPASPTRFAGRRSRLAIPAHQPRASKHRCRV